MAATGTEHDVGKANSRVDELDVAGSSQVTQDATEQSHLDVLTEEELITEKKLRRKIDLLIMPLMVWTYLMNYIDR